MAVFVNANILKLLLTKGVWSYHCYGDGFVADLLLERLRLLPPVHKYALEWLRLCIGHPGVLVSDKRSLIPSAKMKKMRLWLARDQAQHHSLKMTGQARRNRQKKCPHSLTGPGQSKTGVLRACARSRPPKDQETCRREQDVSKPRGNGEGTCNRSSSHHLG